MKNYANENRRLSVENVFSPNRLGLGGFESGRSITLGLDYKREDLRYFTDKVNVTASFKDSEISLTELNVFFDEFGVIFSLFHLTIQFVIDIELAFQDSKF